MELHGFIGGTNSLKLVGISGKVGIKKMEAISGLLGFGAANC